MSRYTLFGWLLRLGIIAAAAWVPVTSRASEQAKGFSPADPTSETVDVLAAIEKGQIAVQLIAKDANQCRLLITNATDRPLTVRLPDVLAGVPVMAQFQNPLQPQGRNRNQRNPNASQPLSLPVPFNANAGPMNNNPLMNVPNRPNNQNNPWPLFNIAPEKTGQLKINSLCLEHGAPSPKPNLAYEIKPLESVTDKAEVREVSRMLGQGQISQRAAQAAAWHLGNGLSWEQLQADRVKLVFGGSHPRFSPQDLAEAKKAVQQAAERIKQREKTSQPALSSTK